MSSPSSSPEYRPLLSHSPPPSYSSSLSSDDRPPAAAKQVSSGDLVWILAGLWSAVFLGALDGTIVATLISPIGSYFNKAHYASYIGTSYLLSVCCFTPLYGRLSDILGRRGAMLLGLSLFGFGTILCGIAPTMNVLIIARAIAGMGGGGIMTVSSVAVTDLIPLKRRGLYQGLCNILFGLGAGIGGPIGGWLNDAFGWRSAFLFQIPVLFFSAILIIAKVDIPLPPDVRSLPLRTKLRRIDFLGSLTLVLTTGSLLLGLSVKTSEDLPWSHPLIWGLLTSACVWAICFVVVESKIAAYPVMPLRLMKMRTPIAVCLSNFFGSMAAFSMLYNVPLYFSAVRLNSSTDAGLHLLPHSLAISTGSVFAGWIMRRTGKLYVLTLLSAALSVAAACAVASWNEDSSWINLWLDLFPQGFGMSSLITTTLIAMIANVSKEDLAVATGITYLYRTTGQVLGVSLSGALLQAVLTKKLRERITGPGAPEIIERLRHSTSQISDLPDNLREIAVDSYAVALKAVFICQVAVAFLTFLSCLPIKENPLPDTMEEQEQRYQANQNARTVTVNGTGNENNELDNP